MTRATDLRRASRHVVKQVLGEVGNSDTAIIGMIEPVALMSEALAAHPCDSDILFSIARIAGCPVVHVDGAGRWIHLAKLVPLTDLMG